MRVAISGVSRGIGEGVARSLLDRGDEVIAFGRTESNWAGVYDKAFEFVRADMADPAALEQACACAQGPIDVLICNAAIFAEGAGTIEHFHPAALAEAFAVNTIAPLIMARTLKPLLEKGSRRLIIMISTGNASIEGNRSGSLLGYRLSKTALNQGARTLAAEWGATGFAVVALNPGWVRTDMGGPNGEVDVAEAARQILDFIDRVTVERDLNGAFVNTDGSSLPW